MEAEQKPLEGLGEAPKMNKAVNHTLIVPASLCSASPNIHCCYFTPLTGCCQAARGNISLGEQKNPLVLLQPSRERSPGPRSIARVLGRQVS